MSRHLSFLGYGKAAGGKARVRTETRENRPSGIVGRPGETWSMKELGTRRTTERVRDGNSPSKDARAPALSRRLAFSFAGLLGVFPLIRI